MQQIVRRSELHKSFARARVAVLSTDMAGVQLDLVVMQRDIKVNNSDLSGLSVIVGALRDDVRDARQCLDKHDGNMNLKLVAQAGCFGALPQSCSNHAQMNCTDNSTKTTEMKSIESQFCLNKTQKHCNDNSTQTIETKSLKLPLCSNYTQTNCNDKLLQSIQIKMAEIHRPKSNQHINHRPKSNQHINHRPNSTGGSLMI